MKNIEAIKARYLHDDLHIRLGGIAANLARISSASSDPQDWEAVLTMLEETKFFIEWTAPDASLNVQAFLVEVQIQLALWQRIWAKIHTEVQEREKLQNWSRVMSERVFTVAPGAFSSPYGNPGD
ncbi:MAG: hypothetical protein WCE90_06345 [Candidatus Zixiibacteriota bacterium]